jgi:hypothetical protein
MKPFRRRLSLEQIDDRIQAAATARTTALDEIRYTRRAVLRLWALHRRYGPWWWAHAPHQRMNERVP